MKNIIAVSMFVLFLMGAASSASAFWGGDDDWKCWGPMGEVPGCNPYDEWDPRYWMEEMEDMFDDDDNYGYGGGGGPWNNGPWSNNRGYAPYGGGYNNYAPYGGGYAPAPYGYAPAPQAAPQQ